MQLTPIVLLAAAAAAASALLLSRAPALPSFAEVRARWRPSDAQLLDRNGDPIHQLRVDRHGRRLAWTPLGEISPALQTAVIKCEDHRFAAHRGVDFIAAAAALAKNLIGAHPRGASTITMQLVSMLDPGLRRAGRHRSALQKLSQMRAALELERRWSKREILESYLNLVTWRAELQGIGAASWVMFGKAPHGITSAQALVLASLLRAPNARAAAVTVRAQALRLSLGADAPTREDVTLALDAAFAARPHSFARLSLAPHLAQRLMGEGAAVNRCTLDGDLQRFASAALTAQVAQVRDRNVDDGAVLVAENSTGEVWAYVGGAGELSRAPYVDSIRALRQPGSALKPFLYALALERRMLTAASLLDDSPLELSEQRGIYRPMDYDRRFRGLVSMRTALASSLNVPAVRTAALVGVEAFADNLRALGFDGVNEAGDYYGSAIALGSAEVTLWQIVNAYRTLANRGEWSPLRLTASDPAAPRRRIYGAGTAYIVSDILSDRASRSATFGLENSLATSFWSAVKTGTSKDMRDNWCIGYTDRFTVGVWVGNSSGAAMRDVTGITGAAPIWLEVTGYLHDRFAGRATERSPGVIAHRVAFPNSVEPERSELFLAGTEPNARLIRLDTLRPRILAPTADSVIAADPDIPRDRQRVSFEGGDCVAGLRWMLDREDLGPANTPILWAPSPGAHRLSIVDRRRRVFDAVSFKVRGGEPREEASLQQQDRGRNP